MSDSMSMDHVQDDDLEWAQGLEPLTGKEFAIPDLTEERSRSHGYFIQCQCSKQSGFRILDGFPSEESRFVIRPCGESRLAIKPCGEVPQPEIVLEAGQPTSRRAQERVWVQVTNEVSNSNGYGSNSIPMGIPQSSNNHGDGFTSNANLRPARTLQVHQLIGQATPSNDYPLRSNMSLLQPSVMPQSNSFYHNAIENVPSPQYEMPQLSGTHVDGFANNAILWPARALQVHQLIGQATPSDDDPLIRSNKSLLLPYVTPPVNSFYYNGNLNVASPHYVMLSGTHDDSFTSIANLTRPARSPHVHQLIGLATLTNDPLPSYMSHLQSYVTPQGNSSALNAFDRNLLSPPPVSVPVPVPEVNNEKTDQDSSSPFLFELNPHLFGADGSNLNQGSQRQELNQKLLLGPTKRRKDFMRDIHNLKFKMDKVQKGVADGEKVDILECTHCNVIFLNHQTYGGHMSHHIKRPGPIDVSMISRQEGAIGEGGGGDEARKQNPSSDRKGKGKLI